jgi:hypothetical protein
VRIAGDSLRTVIRQYRMVVGYVYNFVKRKVTGLLLARINVMGIEIRYNDKTTKVSVEDGMITVHLFNQNGNSPGLKDGDSRMDIWGIDYEKCTRYVWYDSLPINIGDRFEIKVTEIDAPSSPAKTTEDKSVKRPKTKLEFFRELETELKKQGLI